jgi:predicted nucleic acid-binding protein
MTQITQKTLFSCPLDNLMEVVQLMKALDEEKLTQILLNCLNLLNRKSSSSTYEISESIQSTGRAVLICSYSVYLMSAAACDSLHTKMNFDLQKQVKQTFSQVLDKL